VTTAQGTSCRVRDNRNVMCYATTFLYLSRRANERLTDATSTRKAPAVSQAGMLHEALCVIHTEADHNGSEPSRIDAAPQCSALLIRFIRVPRRCGLDAEFELSIPKC